MIGGIVDVRTGARRVVGAVLTSSRLRHDQRLLFHPAITSHHIETTDAGLGGLCIREISVLSYGQSTDQSINQQQPSYGRYLPHHDGCRTLVRA